METEAETPEPASVMKREEAKESICSQFDTVVYKDSLGELQTVKDGHTAPPGSVENSTKAEDSEVVQDFKKEIVNPETEGKVGISESGSFLKSGSLVILASEEICKASKDCEDKVKPILIKTEVSENESQMQKDQTDGSVEVTDDIIEEKIDACCKQVPTEMSLENARTEEVGVAKSSELSTEEKNLEEKVGEKLTALSSTSSSGDLNLQEGKTEGGYSEMEDMKQKNEQLSEKQGPNEEKWQKGGTIYEHLIGNSREASDEQVTEAICESRSIEEEKEVTSSQKDKTEGENPAQVPEFKAREEENIVNNMELEAHNGDGSIGNHLKTHNMPIKDETKEPGFQKAELEGIEQDKSPNLVGMAENPETVSTSEDRENERDEYQHHILDNSTDSRKETNDENTMEDEIQHKNIINSTERVDARDKEVSEESEKDKPKLEKIERPMEAVSEGLEMAASAKSEKDSCEKEEGPAKNHEKSFEQERGNPEPVDLCENIESPRAAEKQELSHGEPEEEIQEKYGETLEEKEHIVKAFEMSKGTETTTIEQEKATGGAAISGFTKTTEMESEKLKTTHDLDPKAKLDNTNAEEIEEEYTTNKEEISDTIIHKCEDIKIRILEEDGATDNHNMSLGDGTLVHSFLEDRNEQNDVKEPASEMTHEDRNFETNDANENMDGTPGEQVIKEPKIVDASEDTKKHTKEKDCTASIKELTQNESSKEDREAKKPGEVNEELEKAIGDQHNEKQNKEDDGTIEDLSTVSNEDENKGMKPKVEVCDEPRTADVSEDTEKVREEDCAIKDIATTSIDEETIGKSTEEDKKEACKANREVWVGLETAGTDEYIEKEIIQEGFVKEHVTKTVGEETIKENSQKDENVGKEHIAEPEVYEGLEVAVASKDIEEHRIQENDVVKDQPTMYVGEEAVTQSSQEDENEVNKLEKEVHERLEETSEGEAVEKQTIQEVSNAKLHTVSIGDQAIKENSQEAEMCEEFKTATAGEDAGNETMRDGAGTDISMVSVRDQTTKESSQEDEEEARKQGGEVREFDLVSMEGIADSTKEIEKMTLKDEEDPYTSPTACDMEAPREEKTQTGGNEELSCTSTVSATSEEQFKEEIPEKTEDEIPFVTMLTKKLSLYEPEQEDDKLADASNFASKEMIPTPIKASGTNSQGLDVEDVKHEENSNIKESVPKVILTTENSDAGEAKQEKSEIPVEASVVVSQSVDRDTETTPVAEITSSKPSCHDKSEEKPQESPMLVSEKQESEIIKIEEKTEDDSPIKDEIIDKMFEAPLVAQTEKEMNMLEEEHMKLEEDTEMGTENMGSSILELDPEKLISEPKEAGVTLEGEKILELNEFIGNIKSETSDPGFKKDESEGDEFFDALSKELETTGVCANMGKDILEQEEDPIKKLDHSFEESTKESMQVEEMLVESIAKDHSHETNDTTRNGTLEQNLKEDDTGEELKNVTESVDHSQNRETLPVTEKAKVEKDGEIIEYQDAVTGEDQMVGQSFQEEEKENTKIEAGLELDVRDQNDEINEVNQPMKNNEEIPHGVESAGESENIRKQDIERDADARSLQVSAGNATVKEVKDSDFGSSEQQFEATYCIEKTETGTSTYVDDLNKKMAANPYTEASGQKILKQVSSEKLEEVSNAPAEVSEENIKKEIEKEADDTSGVLHIESAWEAKPEGEMIAEAFSESTEDEILETDETIGTCIKGGDAERMNLEKTSDLVSQLPTVEKEIREQESVAVEKDAKDVETGHASAETERGVLEKDLPVKNTEERYKKDQIIGETTKLENPETTIEDLPILSSSVDEISKDGGAVKGHDIVSIGDGSVGESFQEDKKGDNIKEAECKLDAGDDQNKKTNEVIETTENEALTEKVPEQYENASEVENNDRQISGKQGVARDPYLVLSGEKAIKESSEEDEKKGDKVKEETINLKPEEQIPNLVTEKVQREDTYEANTAPKNEISHEEVPEEVQNVGKKIIGEGALEDQHWVYVGEESVQESHQGEEMEGKKVEEAATTLEPEKLSSELDGEKGQGGKVNETTEKGIVNEVINSSDLVLVEQEIKTADLNDKTETVTIKDGEDQNKELDVPPTKNAPSEEAPTEVGKKLEEESELVPEELIHETITKKSENKESEAKDATDTEGIFEVKKPSDSVSSPMSIMEKMHNKEELPTDNPSNFSLTEASREEMQGKEGKTTEDEEKKELVFIKQGTREASLPTEEKGENTEDEDPVTEILKEGEKKLNELNIQRKISANEEGETQLLKQAETPQDLQMLEETYLTAEKKIPKEVDYIDRTGEKISISSREIPSMPVGPNGKSLQEAEVENRKHGEALGIDSEVNEVECEADKETINDPKSSEAEEVSLYDLLHGTKTETVHTVGQSNEVINLLPNKEDLENKEAPNIQEEEEKTDEEEKDEERKEDDEHQKADSGSDAPVMVEASTDMDVKPTHKKSHNILSGVGSKVKHSISKVKKAIIGKSSHNKQSSPK